MPEDKKDKVEEVTTVSKEAYDKAQAELLKFKKQAEEFGTKYNQLSSEIEAQNKAALEEKEQWHTLYKKSEEKLKAIETERQVEKQKFVESHKVNAVIQTLGGFKKPEYNKFIDASKINVLEDGSIDDKSVTLEVERIKKEYPELVKVGDKKTLPAGAAKPFTEKSVSEMTPDERAQARRLALTK